MSNIIINYRNLSYETLARIIEISNRLQITAEEAARRFLQVQASPVRSVARVDAVESEVSG